MMQISDIEIALYNQKMFDKIFVKSKMYHDRVSCQVL